MEKNNKIFLLLLRIFTLLTVFILISITTNFSQANAYSQNNAIKQIEFTKETEQKETELEKQINNYINKTKEEYNVVDWTIDLSKLNIPSPATERQKEKQIKNYIEKNTSIKISAKKINLYNTDYYFKNEQKLNDFKDKIEDYNKTIKAEDININLIELSSEDDINNLIEKIKQEAEAKKQQELERNKKQQQQKTKYVTSRSSNSLSSNNTCFPLESYTYMSSPYGSRWRENAHWNRLCSTYRYSCLFLEIWSYYKS